MKVLQKAYGDNNCYGEDNQGERCIALIDYENCSNLKNISLKEYTELIIFTGPLQQNVVLPVNSFPDNVKISIRQTSGVSKNNVDFHLVPEPGRMTCCGEGVIHTILFQQMRDMTGL